MLPSNPDDTEATITSSLVVGTAIVDASAVNDAIALAISSDVIELQLEDLAGMPGATADYDYNDHSWSLNVTQGCGNGSGSSSDSGSGSGSGVW